MQKSPLSSGGGGLYVESKVKKLVIFIRLTYEKMFCIIPALGKIKEIRCLKKKKSLVLKNV